MDRARTGPAAGLLDPQRDAAPRGALNADLHCHSLASDGTLAPAALAERAAAAGVALWALTDHDTLSGQAEARAAAARLGLAWTSGVEISVSFAGVSVHVVGLDFDLGDAALAAGLAALREGRARRAREIARALEACGVEGSYEGALALAGDAQRITRTHFARHLVASGVCANLHQVFRRYLADGRPGDVPHRWASLADAVRWIAAAGGIAVIAHPARYRLARLQEQALFDEFKAAGGRGVEVVTPAHGAAEVARYAALAERLGLLASRGSDFHGPGESRSELGALPDLPRALAPVWREFKAHSAAAAIAAAGCADGAARGLRTR